MKTLFPLVLMALAVAAADSARANVSGLDVTVRKDGKAFYQGKTDTSGSFATNSLEPGAYSVELRAPKSMNLKGQKLAISVSMGKHGRRDSRAEGAHLQSGVALAVDVPKTSRLSGQVTQASRVAEASTKVPEGMEKVKANVKVINGKRHVWVPGPIGSNIGGRWVEEGSEAAALATTNRKGGDGDFLRRMQGSDSGGATLNGRGHFDSPVDTGRGQ